MKAFVVADVHGFYDEMIKALNAAGYEKDNPQHCFVSLGDLLDRGKQPKECLDFVNNIPDTNKILIRGNHEDLIEEAIRRGYFGQHDVHNGTVRTISDLTGLDYEECLYNQTRAINEISKCEALFTYLNSCIDYFENNSIIFVHGWIPVVNEYGIKKADVNWRTGDWEGARWENGFKDWNAGIGVPDKTIWCGHWHTSYAHSKYHMNGVEWPELETKNKKAIFTPFIDVGIVGMDACTAVSGFVNCKRIGRFKNENISNSNPS